MHHLLGIRHHGPGSARSVLAALDELDPDIVLVELPAEAGAPEVLDLVADADLVPPVALLGYLNDRPERAVFYPFARFSPEWQAIRWALGRGVPVRAIDLALGHVLAATGEGDHRRHRGGPPLDPIGELAAAAGEDDPERWWEDVVEHRAVDRRRTEVGSGVDRDRAGSGSGVDRDRDGAASATLAGFEALGEAMATVRAAAPPPVGIEACREAAMRQAIRLAEHEGRERIAVVCGAWHVPALVAPLSPASADRVLLTGLPKAKVTLTWVPWTHRRLLSGSYGAGISSPGWYAHVFDSGGDHRRWFADVAWLLRSKDHLVSPDHLVAATRVAEGLAALRGRPRPGLAEVTDAAEAVLGDGRPGPLALIHDRLVVGDVLGRVPERAPMVPLARHLAAEQKRVRMKPSADEKVLELDLRVPLGRERSHLLHRLAGLGIHWGRPDEGRGSSGSFRESWRVRWEPELSVQLIEASAYGTTIPAAAAARIGERGDQATSLGDLVALAELSLLADLPDCLGPLLDRLAALAAERTDAGELLDLLGPLARILRYGDVRGTDGSGLAGLFDTVARRACAGLVVAAAQLDDDCAALFAERLLAANGALALLDHPLRAGSWADALLRLAGATAAVSGVDGVHGIVAGRAVRLLSDAELLDAERVAGALSRALSPGTPARAGAAFVDGLLAGAGTVLLHDSALLGLLDEWLVELAADTFDDIIALLRRTFGAFEVAERRRLGDLVSGRGDGRVAAAFGWDLDEPRAFAGLATLCDLWGIPVDAITLTPPTDPRAPMASAQGSNR